MLFYDNCNNKNSFGCCLCVLLNAQELNALPRILTIYTLSSNTIYNIVLYTIRDACIVYSITSECYVTTKDLPLKNQIKKKIELQQQQ